MSVDCHRHGGEEVGIRGHAGATEITEEVKAAEVLGLCNHRVQKRVDLIGGWISFHDINNQTPTPVDGEVDRHIEHNGAKGLRERAN